MSSMFLRERGTLGLLTFQDTVETRLTLQRPRSLRHGYGTSMSISSLPLLALMILTCGSSVVRPCRSLMKAAGNHEVVAIAVAAKRMPRSMSVAAHHNLASAAVICTQTTRRNHDTESTRMSIRTSQGVTHSRLAS